MDHVAIMRKEWKLIDKVLSGEKTIESRWYKTRRAPWGKIKKGDMIYFKDAGQPVRAKAQVANVMQAKILDNSHLSKILDRYGRRICLKEPEFVQGKKYCILIFLKNSRRVRPFNVKRSNGNAWLIGRLG